MDKVFRLGNEAGAPDAETRNATTDKPSVDLELEEWVTQEPRTYRDAQSRHLRLSRSAAPVPGRVTAGEVLGIVVSLLGFVLGHVAMLVGDAAHVDTPWLGFLGFAGWLVGPAALVLLGYVRMYRRRQRRSTEVRRTHIVRPDGTTLDTSHVRRVTAKRRGGYYAVCLDLGGTEEVLVDEIDEDEAAATAERVARCIWVRRAA